jgi:ankyrin repeat protein
LQKGAKINENERVINWFHSACKYGHTGVVELMIKYKFDFHGNPNEGHEKGLRIAVANDNLPIVKILVEAGADIHAAQDKPLRVAVANDHIEILKYLHEHGVKFTLALINLAIESKAVNVMKYMKDSIRENRKKKLKKFFHLKENLYERFEEESDPITDMGIGYKVYRQALMEYRLPWKLNALNNLSEILEKLFDSPALEEVYYLAGHDYTLKAQYNNDGSYEQIEGYIDEGKLIKRIDAEWNDKPCTLMFYETEVGKICNISFNGITSPYRVNKYAGDLEAAVKIYKPEKIDESFKEESDPVKDMGIGMEKEVRKFKQYANNDRNADVFQYDNSIDRLLCWGAFYNRYDIVDYTIGLGADINYHNGTPAAFSYNIEMGLYLVKKGADFKMSQKEAIEQRVSKDTIEGLKKIKKALGDE